MQIVRTGFEEKLHYVATNLILLTFHIKHIVPKIRVIYGLKQYNTLFTLSCPTVQVKWG